MSHFTTTRILKKSKGQTKPANNYGQIRVLIIAVSAASRLLSFIIVSMNLAIIIATAIITLIGLFPIVLHWVYRVPRLIESTTPESLSLSGSKSERPFFWMIQGKVNYQPEKTKEERLENYRALFKAHEFANNAKNNFLLMTGSA